MCNDRGHYQGSYSERKECGVIGAYTNASDLVKITDYLIQEPNGHGVVEKYLNDINHEIKHSASEDYDFDEELIDSYRNLQDNDINIDLKLLNDRQIQIINSVMEIW